MLRVMFPIGREFQTFIYLIYRSLYFKKISIKFSNRSEINSIGNHWIIQSKYLYPKKHNFKSQTDSNESTIKVQQ